MTAQVNKSPLWFIGVNPTADLVIQDCNGKILMVKRQNNPYQGCLALPGGFVDSSTGKDTVHTATESPMDAAIRELKEETGVDLLDTQDLDHLKYVGVYQGLDRLKVVGVYEEIGRDPRDSEERWTQSHAFCVDLECDSDQIELEAQEGEVLECVWIDKYDLIIPARAEKQGIMVAFDHLQIIQDALDVQRQDKQRDELELLENSSHCSAYAQLQNLQCKLETIRAFYPDQINNPYYTEINRFVQDCELKRVTQDITNRYLRHKQIIGGCALLTSKPFVSFKLPNIALKEKFKVLFDELDTEIVGSLRGRHVADFLHYLKLVLCYFVQGETWIKV